MESVVWEHRSYLNRFWKLSLLSLLFPVKVLRGVSLVSPWTVSQPWLARATETSIAVLQCWQSVVAIVQVFVIHHGFELLFPMPACPSVTSSSCHSPDHHSGSGCGGRWWPNVGRLSQALMAPFDFISRCLFPKRFRTSCFTVRWDKSSTPPGCGFLRRLLMRWFWNPLNHWQNPVHLYDMYLQWVLADSILSLGHWITRCAGIYGYTAWVWCTWSLSSNLYV